MWAVPPQAAQPTPAPSLGEPPQAVNTVQIRAMVETWSLGSLARASLARLFSLFERYWPQAAQPAPALDLGEPPQAASSPA